MPVAHIHSDECVFMRGLRARPRIAPEKRVSSFSPPGWTLNFKRQPKSTYVERRACISTKKAGKVAGGKSELCSLPENRAAAAVVRQSSKWLSDTIDARGLPFCYKVSHYGRTTPCVRRCVTERPSGPRPSFPI